jgi:hypothetical protein
MILTTHACKQLYSTLYNVLLPDSIIVASKRGGMFVFQGSKTINPTMLLITMGEGLFLYLRMFHCDYREYNIKLRVFYASFNNALVISVLWVLSQYYTSTQPGV